MTANAPLLFLRDAAARGERGVLVTITAIVGSASRALGTHLAVAESGNWCGSLSGGCIEAAVAAEARRVLERGQAEIVRFGAGSRFIDIRLPCGGGLDLLFTPEPSAEAIDAACAFIDARSPFSLRLRNDGGVAVDERAATTGWEGDVFSVRHHPALRLVVAGQGEEAAKAVALAQAYGAETVLWTSDPALLSDGAHLLKTAADSAAIATDAYSAALLLFHEHEWETELLLALLAQPAFFIGAMGSPATHAARVELLRESGATEDDLARITGPVGLIPATREPATLALSALAEIVARYRDLVE